MTNFEYDIFISYRHNDNLDGWVTTFVQNLEKELRGTIKDPVSVYFDTNPHDGLSAHHDVDDSLREKLKCRIFIPIVSRTYCDENSFAWKHEFLAFADQASRGSFGLKVKLPNGNVASRVLPLRIHEIDKVDTALFESITGSVMRPIDLVFKSAGVNRPLLEQDKKEENNNHTLYRDQINRVANAIDEILKAMKSGPLSEQVARQDPAASRPVSRSPKRKWFAIAATMILVAAAAIYLTYLKAPGLKEASESGLAVLPFRNNTGEESLNYYGVGMASEIRTKLSMSKEFGFLSALQATMAYNNSNKSPQQIGSELGVDYLLSGIYHKSGQKIKVDVELLDAATGKVVWTLPIEKEEADIFQVQADIAQKVLTKFYSLKPQAETEAPTTSLEGYSHFLNGMALYNHAFDFVSNREFETLAIEQFEKAIQPDSSFQEAWLMLIETHNYKYLNTSNDSLRRRQIETYIQYLDRHFPGTWQSNLAHGSYEYRVAHRYDRAVEYISKVLALDPDNQLANQLMSYVYKRKLDYVRALAYKRKVFEINPSISGEWNDLAAVLASMGDDQGAYKAHLKGWEMGFGENIGSGNTLFSRVIAAGIPRQSIPESYKRFLGEHYELRELLRENEWRKAATLAIKLKRYEEACLAFQNLNMQDSVKHYANLALVNSVSQSFDVSYAFLGERSKALTTNDLWWGTRIDTKDDKYFQCIRLMQHARLLSCAGDYPGAVSKIKELNSQYPEYNNYGIALNSPWFAKIRREYPPFLKAINERKQLPMPDVSEIIKF